jgi:outer membrane protein TolC
LNFEVVLEKKFTSGQNARLVGALEHIKKHSENNDEVDEDELSDSDPILSESSAGVFLEVTQPLLRNRGKDASGAEEKSAQIIVNATEVELRDKIAKSLLDTTLAYWNYAAAKKILDIKKEVANSFRQDVNDINNILNDDDDDDDDDDVETEEGEAEVFARDTAMVRAEQDFFATKQELGLVMGLISYVDIRNLPEPEYRFAKITASERNNIDSFVPHYQEKMRQRHDAILVLEQLKESAQVLVHAAKRNLQPRLDLVGRIGYTGSERGKSSIDSFTAFGRHTRGFDWVVGGQFSYPFGNNAAEGLLRKEKAALAELKIQQLDLIRTIDSSIITLVEELTSSSIEIDLTINTIKLFKKAFDQQKSDFNEEPDLGKLIDLITVENDWIDARLEKVEQELRHASAIASLAYETGDVLEPGSGYEIRVNSLTRLPVLSIPADY